MYITRTQKFLNSDYTIAINTTAIDGTDFTSNIIDVRNVLELALTFEVKGTNEGCSANITFTILSSYDGINWDDANNYYLQRSVTMNGTSQQRVTINVVAPVAYLKLYSIQNPETTAGRTAVVNIVATLKEKARA